MKSKIKLQSLRISSFSTDIASEAIQTIKGGGKNTPLHTQYVSCESNNSDCWINSVAC